MLLGVIAEELRPFPERSRRLRLERESIVFPLRLDADRQPLADLLVAWRSRRAVLGGLREITDRLVPRQPKKLEQATRYRLEVGDEVVVANVVHRRVVHGVDLE